MAPMGGTQRCVAERRSLVSVTSCVVSNKGFNDAYGETQLCLVTNCVVSDKGFNDAYGKTAFVVICVVSDKGFNDAYGRGPSDKKQNSLKTRRGPGACPSEII